MLLSPLATWRNILFFPLGCGELGYDNVPGTCTYVRCYGMVCFGTYLTHVQTCDNVRVQSATEWTASVHTLDKKWGNMKRFVPNSITTKDATSALLNGDIWDYVYQWQWRYNNRDRLWETVPQILAEIADHH